MKVFLRRGDAAAVRIEVHLTRCIVREFEKHDTLITSANSRLIGARLPYFPRGGPVPPDPPQNSSDTWGGLEIGHEQLYRSQCVDGMLDAVAPSDWRKELSSKFSLKPGEAIATNAPESIKHRYQTLVHAVAPFYSDENYQNCLHSTYVSALTQSKGSSCALPLIGAGARGFPVTEAARLAAISLDTFFHTHPSHFPSILRFGCLDPVVADKLSRALAEYVPPFFFVPSTTTTTPGSDAW